MNLEAIPTYN